MPNFQLLQKTLKDREYLTFDISPAKPEVGNI